MVKKRRWLALAGLTILSAGVLAACGNQGGGSETKGQTYSYVYSTDPDSLDYIRTSRDTTTSLTDQSVDGLLERDKYGNLVPSIAEDWTVSEDGLTYTYKLREDAYWYTADGEEYAQVTAEDFVTSLKYAADNEAEALYVIQESIKGLNDYVEGTNKDFSAVGIKAVDDFTLEYTLNAPEPFWNSKTTYGVLAPVNAEFLKSQGEDFGSLDPSSILYNGPFVLKSLTAKSSIEFEKNENYWDADTVKIDEIQLTYYDGSNPDDLYKNFDEGNYNSARLFPTSPIWKEVQKKYGDNIYYNPQDGTTYFASFNLDRAAYEFTGKTDDAQKESTKKAILNKDFRQAMTFAFNRAAYNSQNVGKDAAEYSLRNTLVPPTFVTSEGQDFGSMLNKEMATKGDEWKDVDLSDAQDGLYNAEKAKAEFAKAKTALEAEGVSFPIHIDIAVDQANEVQNQQIASVKQSIEESLGKDNVVIDIQKLSSDDYERTGYFAETGSQQDWDLSLASGWGPDYEDPSTYLNIFSPTSGSNIKVLGLNDGETAEIAAKVGLDEYDTLLDDAAKITDNLTERYQAYAKAQAWLTDNALVIPTYSRGGTPVVSNLVPFSGAYGWTAGKGSSGSIPALKYTEIQDEPVTTKEYEKAKKAWQKEKEESNAKYQEELADHVKK